MNTFNINNIWNSDSDKARNHYESVKDDVEQMARRKSDNILNQVHRKFVWELIASVFVVVIIAFGIYSYMEHIFWAYIGLTVVAFYISLKLYLNLRKEIKKVNHRNVVKSLEEYIRIIKLYIRRSKRFVRIVAPSAYVLGFVMSLLSSDIEYDLQAVLVIVGTMVVIGVPLIWLLIWLTNKKYYKLMYEKHVYELEDILTNLKNDLKEPLD